MLSIKQINTKIRSISKRNATLREDIQTVLCNIAGHAYQHGDPTAVEPLLKAVVGQDKKAIIGFLETYCFVKVARNDSVSVNKKARKDAEFVSGDECTAYLLELAPKWYDNAQTTEQAVRALDPTARLRKLEKDIKDPKREVEINMDEVESAMRDLLGTISARRRGMLTSEHIKEVGGAEIVVNG